MVLDHESRDTWIFESTYQSLCEPSHGPIDSRPQEKPYDDGCDERDRKSAQKGPRAVVHRDSRGSAKVCAQTIHSEIPKRMTSDCQMKMWASLKYWGRNTPM